MYDERNRPSHGFVFGLHSTLRLGRIVVPVNPRSAPASWTTFGETSWIVGRECVDGIRKMESRPRRTGFSMW